MTKTIELDMAHDQDDASIRNWAAIHNVGCYLVTRDGPGGGNPVWSFTGPTDNIDDLVREYYDTGDLIQYDQVG